MSDERPSLDELVKIYLTIRGEREILARQFDAKDGELKSELASIEQVMLAECNSINADSIRTGNGTVIKSLKESYVCSDWDNLKDFILENQAVELLQQRIHQKNFKEFMDNHQGEGLPPGINVMREFGITVRKPTKSQSV
jgi:hypothetical protein